jgi:hypothetical protein
MTTVPSGDHSHLAEIGELELISQMRKFSSKRCIQTSMNILQGQKPLSRPSSLALISSLFCYALFDLKGQDSQ